MSDYSFRSRLFGYFPLSKGLIWKPYAQLQAWQLRRFLVKRFGPYAGAVVRGSIPNKEIFELTGGESEEKTAKMFAPGAAFEHRYLGIGRATVLQMLRAVELSGGNVRTMTSVLEFGCGTGRLIRHFQMIVGLRLCGCDLNPKMVTWCRKALPKIRFEANGPEPPLPFDDATFDLTFSYSVFTHIPVETQGAWAAEMYRVTRPGGFMVATVSGSWLQRIFLSDEERQKVSRNGYIQFGSDSPRASLATRLGGSPWDVYQPRADIIDMFRRYFEIVDFIPGFQDFVVARRKS